MVVNYVLWGLQPRCPFSCRSCGYSSGPNGELPSEDDVKTIISNFPKVKSCITFSGGEPLYEKKLLYGALEQIRDNKYRIFSGRPEVDLFTNGFWLDDYDKALEIIGELTELGVDYIRVSLDKYHSEQSLKVLGWDTADLLNGNLVKDLRDAIKDLYDDRIVLELQDPNDYGDSLPVGRARKLPRNEWKFNSTCDAKYFQGNSLYIGPNGDVFFCGFGKGPKLGSALEEPVDKIVDFAKDRLLVANLIHKGIAGAYRAKNGKSVFEESESHPCLICEKIF